MEKRSTNKKQTVAGFGLASFQSFCTIVGMSGYRDEYTPEKLHAVAARFANLAARLAGMADAMTEHEIQSVSLKLGTATGTLFDRINSSLDQAEFDVIKAVRIARDTKESAIIGDRISRTAEEIAMQKRKGKQ
jgi:hypothetical protein